MTFVSTQSGQRMGGLLGQQQPTGLLEWLASPQAQGMAQGLLAASAPSRVPVGFGQALGMGMQGAQAAQKDARQQQMDDLLLQIKLEEISRKRESEAQRQEMLSKVLGGQSSGGALDPTSLATAGLMTGDSDMLAYAKFMQDQKEKNPSYIAQVEQEKQQAKSKADKTELYGSMTSKMPGLIDTVEKLSALGKTATYTGTGRAIDALVRETGPMTGYTSTPGATSRTEYISMVDNQILPLLRDTFGAQFTQKEGETLRASLGDPNKSPEEKDAILRSFIDQKVATINSLGRELGLPPTNIEIPKTLQPPAQGGQQLPGGWTVRVK